MDGENNGKPYEQMDDLGGFSPYFWFNTHMGNMETCPRTLQWNPPTLCLDARIWGLQSSGRGRTPYIGDSHSSHLKKIWNHEFL